MDLRSHIDVLFILVAMLDLVGHVDFYLFCFFILMKNFSFIK